MILSFKPQFKQPILDGTKIHTIREDPNRRWLKGRKIQMATGVRTKHYNCFKEAQCTGTQRVFMTYAHNDIIQISINGDELHTYQERLQFALNDGFPDWESFFEWFYPICKANERDGYSARIIHWTDYRY